MENFYSKNKTCKNHADCALKNVDNVDIPQKVLRLVRWHLS